jgi:hypothetical protein
MGMLTDFMGNLTTSRPLTQEELEEYQNLRYSKEDVYLLFEDGSNNKLCGPEGEKLCGYVDMEKGFLDTYLWMKSKDIKLTGRINYVSEYMLTDFVGGFGAFVATDDNVTYHKFDFNGLKMISTIIC